MTPNEPEEPEQHFRDSWRPEDKALESAEEEALEKKFPDEIEERRAHRHAPSGPPSEAP